MTETQAMELSRLEILAEFDPDQERRALLLVPNG